jgi:glycogen debranching enzyme
MTTPFNLAGPTLSWAGPGELVTLVEGASFCITTSSGDIVPGLAGGLFFRDARLISRWELYVDGERTEPLSVQPTDPFAGVFIGRPHPRPGQPEGTLVVVRRRLVSQGMCEEITLHNYGSERAAVTLTVVVEADFADLFSVKEGRAGPPGPQRADTGDGKLGIWPASRQDGAGVVVRSDCGDPVVAPGSMSFQAVIEPRGEWHVCLDVVPATDGEPLPPGRLDCQAPVEHSTAAVRLAAWREASARIHTTYPPLARTLRRTSADLGSLRIFDPHRPDLPAVAAGAPWYMTLFGRDSLLTSWMALLVDPQLAIGTLHMLAELQGSRVDPVSEEEPGRILHEMRHGGGLGGPGAGSPVYYGTADATGLFVMLLGELYRWGHGDAVRHLVPNADRALAWITEYGDRDGDGFVEYRRATDKGLLNQGWKDSWDGISFAGGRLADSPIALCEVQAYSYGAYLARAGIARADGDSATADRYAEAARDLKRAFNDAFWIPGQGYLALALDADKKQVDALASNAGHCLWTGILDEDKAERTADLLLSPEMFTGWGLRTLSTSAGRYNPVSYHNGSVWPHDTAIAIAGLVRYGFTEHAQRLAAALLDAAAAFDGRLPELFCGFDRKDFAAPVTYPSSCSPQAWASAAPLLIVRSLLGFSPSAPDGDVALRPALMPEIGALRVEGLRIGERRANLVADGDAAWVEDVP